MPSDDSTTPRPARRPAASRQSGAASPLRTSFPPLPFPGLDDIFSQRVGGVIFLALPSSLAPDLLDAANAVVDDPTADERYGERAVVQLTGLAEALAEALTETRVRRRVRKRSPKA